MFKFTSGDVAAEDDDKLGMLDDEREQVADGTAAPAPEAAAAAAMVTFVDVGVTEAEEAEVTKITGTTEAVLLVVDATETGIEILSNDWP